MNTTFKLIKSLALVFTCLFLPSMAIAQNNQSAIGNKIRMTQATSVAPSSSNYDDIKRFLQNFNSAFQEARNLGNDYRLARVLLQDQIADLKAVVPVDKPRIDQLEAKLKSLKKQEKVAQSNIKKFRKYKEQLVDIESLSLKKQEKLVAAVESGYQKMPRVFAPPTIVPLPSDERPIVRMTDPTKKMPNKAQARKQTRPSPVSSSTSKVGYTSYDIKKDVLFNPPSATCNYRFKGMDEFLGKEKTEVEPAPFFFHTDPELRPYMKGQEYIECIASLANTQGGVSSLNIEVYIRSQNAQREFGGLQKGSTMTIRFVNGEIAKLLGVNGDNGVYDAATGLTVFRNQFVVQKADEKAFLESEIDKIRLVWSNGYEDYDVYNVDFLMNQMNCLYSN